MSWNCWVACNGFHALGHLWGDPHHGAANTQYVMLSVAGGCGDHSQAGNITWGQMKCESQP